MKRFLFLAILILLLGLGISFYYASDSIQAGVRKIVANARYSNSINDSLVGFWTFDGPDVTGTTATDRGSGGNNGTLTGGPVVGAGVVGQALNFDGVDDYIALGDIGINSDTVAFTISSWVFLDSDTTQQMIVSNNSGSAAEADNLNILIYFPASAELILDIGKAQVSSARITTNATFSKNQWYHVVGTYDGSRTYGGLKLYVNGTQEATTNGGDGFPSPGPTNKDLWHIGTQKGSTGSGDSFLNGLIDEVRVYNRVLTAAEISYLFTRGNPGQRSTSNMPQNNRFKDGLIGYWTFNGPDVSGTTATDLSSGGNNGTLTNGPVVGEGVVGQALNFDGVDDYISLPSYTPTNDISATAWIYFTSAPSGSESIWGVADSTGFNAGAFYYTDTPDLRWAIDTTAVNRRYWGASVTLSANRWYHVAFTQSGGPTATPTMYVDGVSYSASLLNTAGTPSYSSQPQAIGRFGGYDGLYFPGIIDEVRVYNRALSAAEVQEIYLAGAVEQRTKTNVSQNDRYRSGLVGYWPFNGSDFTQAITGSSTATDRGGSNNGEVTGGTAVTEGIAGQALQLDGVNDYVDMKTVVLNSSGNFTVSAWIRPKTSGSNFPFIVSEIGTENSAGQFGFRLGDSDNIQFFRRTGTGVNIDYISGNSAIPINQWTHAVGVYSGGSTLDVYVNGVDDGGTVTPETYSASDVTTTRIGADEAVLRPFPGTLDEVRIYNRALSAAEIAEIYTASRRE